MSTDIYTEHTIHKFININPEDLGSKENMLAVLNRKIHNEMVGKCFSEIGYISAINNEKTNIIDTIIKRSNADIIVKVNISMSVFKVNIGDSLVVSLLHILEQGLFALDIVGKFKVFIPKEFITRNISEYKPNTKLTVIIKNIKFKHDTYRIIAHEFNNE